MRCNTSSWSAATVIMCYSDRHLGLLCMFWMECSFLQSRLTDCWWDWCMNKSLSLKLRSCHCSVSICYESSMFWLAQHQIRNQGSENEKNLARRYCVAGCLQMFDRGNCARKLLLLITLTSGWVYCGKRISPNTDPLGILSGKESEEKGHIVKTNRLPWKRYEVNHCRSVPWVLKVSENLSNMTLWSSMCQVRVTVGDSGLCCVCVTSFKC